MSANPPNTLTDSQQATATVVYDDKKGNPATVSTVPVWVSSDTTILTVDASGDPTGMTAVVKAVGALGSAQITVTDTPTDGSAPIVVVGTINVVSDVASAAAFQLGTPSEQ